MMGIPAIFLRSDVLAAISPQVWDYDTHVAHTTQSYALADRCVLLHEVRHFHDAILSPFLFQQFIYETQRNYLASQFLPALASHNKSIVAKDELDSQCQELLAFHQETQRVHSQKYREYFQPKYIEAITATLSVEDLLEANAMISEVCWIEIWRSHSCAEHFLKHCCEHLDFRYRWWTKLIEKDATSFCDAFRTLHQIISACLYVGWQPLEALDTLLGLQTGFGTCFADHVPLEEIIADGIATAREEESFCFTGFVDDNCDLLEPFSIGQSGRESIAEFYILPSELYRIRERLTGQFADLRFDIHAYVRECGNMAAPPTFFYADDVMYERNILPFARWSMLKDGYSDVYVLSEYRDETLRTVIDTAIVQTPGFNKCIRLNAVDTMASMRYMCQRIFDETISFGRRADENYVSMLESQFGLRIS